MLKDGKILLGKAGEKEIFIEPKQMNRHGLIAGASGTGKTVTLKVVAESLSELGVPTFIADVKGDLSGMIVKGNQEGIQERLDSMGITGFETRSFPVRFWDVYKKWGLPLRTVCEEIDPLFLARMLELSDAQTGVLNIIFKVAEDMDLDIIDLKDLQAMTEYVADHSKDLTAKYGNVTKQSVGAIQRKLLQLDEQDSVEGSVLLGTPQLDIADLMAVDSSGMGYMNILEANELFNHPLLYSTFLMMILDRLYRELPEVGDLEKPKMVFFFDEAHLLFDGAGSQLRSKIEQTVKLIRSKGVGIFFCTQSPTDIPNEVLAQLSNRIQHALRAYTPNEIKAVKTASASFRPNPTFDTAEVITTMKTGHALVSVLDEEGAPTIVEETKILPPKSSMNIADDSLRQATFKADSLFMKYWDEKDPASAYEGVIELKAQEEQERIAEEEEKKKQKLAEIEEREKARSEARKKANRENYTDRIAKKVARRAETEIINAGVKTAKSFLKGFLKK